MAAGGSAPEFFTSLVGATIAARRKIHMIQHGQYDGLSENFWYLKVQWFMMVYDGL